jgi:hypothetical protein
MPQKVEEIQQEVNLYSGIADYYDFVMKAKVKFKFFKGELRDKIMREGGFELQGVYEINDRQDFYLYQVKVA